MLVQVESNVCVLGKTGRLMYLMPGFAKLLCFEIFHLDKPFVLDQPLFLIFVFGCKML